MYNPSHFTTDILTFYHTIKGLHERATNVNKKILETVVQQKKHKISLRVVISNINRLLGILHSSIEN